MQCPNCQTVLPDGSMHCFRCGAALRNPGMGYGAPQTAPGYNAPQNQGYNAPGAYTPQPQPQPMQDVKPMAVRNACRSLIKSPLMLIAIIAYTIYAAIMTLQMFPMMDYFGVLIEGIGEAPLIAIAFLVIMFLYIPAIFLCVGLWKMFASHGFDGAGLTRGSITAIRSMKITAIGALVLQLVILAGKANVALTDAGFEELLLPLAAFVFSMVAVGAMRNVAEGVSYTAIYEKANIEGILSAGIMLLVLSGLELFAMMEVSEELSQLNVSAILLGLDVNKDQIQLANVMYVVALALFGIGSIVFHTNITRAYEVDEHIRYQKKLEKESVKAMTGPKIMAEVYTVPNTAQPKKNTEEDTIGLLKKYKELLDSGVITQEEYNQKKSQLLAQGSEKP